MSAQFKPKVAVSYNFSDDIRITDKMSIVTYYLPRLNVRTGLEYKYKGLSVYYDTRIWCRYANRASFSPEQAVFEVGANYKITDKITISINHICYHPLVTSGDTHAGIYGGHQGITISYGY